MFVGIATVAIAGIADTAIVGAVDFDIHYQAFNIAKFIGRVAVISQSSTEINRL